MKSVILIVSLFFTLQVANGQNVKLNYMVAIAKFQQYYNQQNADSLYAMYSAQMRAALSPDKTKELLSNLNNQFGKLKSTEIFDETAEKTIYKGSFEKGDYYIVFPLNDKNQLNGLFFKPVEKKEETSGQEHSNFNANTSSGVTLFGTLLMPTLTKIKPNVVLIIAGSGPTDRNCNSELGLKSNAFKMLADSLAKAGIASVRYDKRGVGESVGAATSESETRFTDMVDDAVSFLKKIKASGQFGKIFIAGHSEGSLIAMIAANKEGVDGLISLSGPGESADKTLIQQLKTAMPTEANEASVIIKSLKEGKTKDVKNEKLASLFRPSVQPYMISWFAYDPQIEIKKLNIPILIIQGSTDLQVSLQDAQRLHSAQPNSKMLIINEMNHVLKHADLDRDKNLATYNQPDLPIVSELSKAIIQFCK